LTNEHIVYTDMHQVMSSVRQGVTKRSLQ